MAQIHPNPALSEQTLFGLHLFCLKGKQIVHGDLQLPNLSSLVEFKSVIELYPGKTTKQVRNVPS